MPQTQSGVKSVISVRGQWWALLLTDKVGISDPSDCGMPGRELLLVDEAQLVGYLLGLANSFFGVGRSHTVAMRMASLSTLFMRRE